jgi:hypothetical protein
MIVTIGINVNDSKERWTDFLLSGAKTIETRNTNSLKSYIGKVVGIIRTGLGKAEVVGFARIGEPIVYNTIDEFRADADRHGIQEGSTFDFNGKKYGYPIEVIQKLDSPIKVNSLGIVSRKIQPYEIY